MKMLRLFGLEIEIKRDDGPITVIALFERLLHVGTHTLEEILLHRWFITVTGQAVRDDRP